MPKGSRVWATTLRLLARRRLSEVQLRERLRSKDFPELDVNEAITRAQGAGYIDDRLYAALYLEIKSSILGDRRLVGDLIKRGISREIALEALQTAPVAESERLQTAYVKLRRCRPGISPPTMARALASQGFATPGIYRLLQLEGQKMFDC